MISMPLTWVGGGTGTDRDTAVGKEASEPSHSMESSPERWSTSVWTFPVKGIPPFSRNSLPCRKALHRLCQNCYFWVILWPQELPSCIADMHHPGPPGLPWEATSIDRAAVIEQECGWTTETSSAFRIRVPPGPGWGFAFSSFSAGGVRGLLYMCSLVLIIQ